MLNWWVVDKMEKVFPENGKPFDATEALVLSAAGNEREDGQIIIRPDLGVTVVSATAQWEELVTDDGQTISPDQGSSFWVWYTYVQANPPRSPDPAHWLRKAPAFFPDAFIEEERVRIEQEWTQPLWVKIHVPEGARPGLYSGAVAITCECADAEGSTTETIRVPVSLTVWPFSLASEKRLLHTEWTSPDLLARYYNLEPWSEPHWEWVERCAVDMAAHEQNMILTPYRSLVRTTETADGLTYDYSRLDRWIAVHRRAGIRWIEGGHVGGRDADKNAGDHWKAPFAWGRITVVDEAAEGIERYKTVTGEERKKICLNFYEALFSHLRERWGLERFVQHIGDEPIDQNSASWKVLAESVRSVAPELRIIEATMSKELAGVVDIQIPQIQSLDKELIEDGKTEHWCYVCLAPQGAGPNRFLDQDSIRNRIIFWICFARKLTGFLHWGYNYWGSWNPGTPDCVQFSPWADATAGSIYSHHRQPLPPGDPFVVYPGREQICSSIRWEIVRKGVEDYELLCLLEEAADADGAASDAGRAAAALIESIRIDHARGADHYCTDHETLNNLRQQAGELLSELTGSSSQHFVGYT